MSAERWSLRPMEDRDLEQVLAWRNTDRIRDCMFSDALIAMDAHRAWWERAKHNPASRHLVFEGGGVPLGVVNVTGIDPVHGRCSWGFYLGDATAPRGTGTRMGLLALDYIFGALGVRKLCAEVIATNVASLGYHRRLGFSEEGRFVRHVLKHGCYEDVVAFALFGQDWSGIRQHIEASYGGRREQP